MTDQTLHCRESLKRAIYDDLCAADNNDVPLEDYPERILRIIETNTRAQASAPEGGERFDAWWNRNGDGSVYGRGIALDAWNEMSKRNKSALDFKQTVIDQAMARIKELESDVGIPVPVRYFAADPAEGEFDTFATLDEAKSKAEQLLECAGDAAYEDGWADEPPQICYGIVIAGCEEEPGSRKPAPEGSDFTEMVSFRLTDPTYTRSNAKASDSAWDEEWLALKFHETYERLAPSYGYETRKETRAFDPESPNGRLMIAVCKEIIGSDCSNAKAGEVE